MFQDRLSYPWFAIVCSEIIILSNIIHIESTQISNGSFQCEIVFTGKFPFPWIFSVLISTFLIAFSSRYSGILARTTESLKGFFIYIHLIMFFLTLFALTYSALSFLDEDTYSSRNYKWALFALGFSQIMIALIDLITFLQPYKKIKDYIIRLFESYRLEPISREWGIRIGIGVSMICFSQGFHTIPGDSITLDIIIAVIIFYLFVVDLRSSMLSSKEDLN